MYAATTTTSRPPLREGLLVGSTLGLVLIILRLLSLPGYAGTLVSALALALALAAYFVSGLQAAQQTGSIQTGAFAGLVTAFVSSLLSLGAMLIVTVMRQEQLHNTLSSLNLALQQAGINFHITESLLLGGMLLGLLVVLLLSLLVGLAMGALGGSLGKQRRQADIY